MSIAHADALQLPGIQTFPFPICVSSVLAFFDFAIFYTSMFYGYECEYNIIKIIKKEKNYGFSAIFFTAFKPTTMVAGTINANNALKMPLKY